MRTSATFSVVIPAAGLSRRMGRPKLLLPWGASTVIATLIRELQSAGICAISVVLRRSDTELRNALVELDVMQVIPDVDPPDMRTSVELGLLHWKSNWMENGGWFLIPADHPLVSAMTIRTMLSVWRPNERQILIPTFEGQRGHPTLFSWDFASEVSDIPAGNGVNWLVRSNSQAVLEVPVADAGVTADLDTPEDYARFYDHRRSV